MCVFAYVYVCLPCTTAILRIVLYNAKNNKAYLHIKHLRVDIYSASEAWRPGSISDGGCSCPVLVACWLVCGVDRTGRLSPCAGGGTIGVSRAPMSWLCPAAPVIRAAAGCSGTPAVDAGPDYSDEISRCNRCS